LVLVVQKGRFVISLSIGKYEAGMCVHAHVGTCGCWHWPCFHCW